MIRDFLVKLMRINAMRLERWNFNRQHFDDFIHTRLWIGVPVVVGVMFALVIAKEAVMGIEDIGDTMIDGLLCGALLAFCWIVGIWCATGPDPVPTEEDEMDSKTELWIDSLPRPWSVSIRVLFIVLAVSAIFCFEIIEFARGEMDWVEVLMIAFLKILTLSCVIIPVWLSQIGKS